MTGCIHRDCKKIASFNKIGEKKAIYCKDHKLPNMRDVKNKKCIRSGCDKIPSFNVEGEVKAIYCADHIRNVV